MTEQPGKKRRICFINRYFYPDHSATSQIVSDLAVHLSQNGYEVGVITSRMKYDDASVSLPEYESIHGVDVFRIWTTRFGRGRLLGRAVDYASFYMSALVYMLRHVKSGDVVVAKTDPPLISVVAYGVVRAKRARLINWLQDVFPEVAEALGIKSVSALYPFLRWLRNKSLYGACMNVAIGEKMSERLQAQGVPESRMAVIHNWAIGEEIEPVDRSANILRSRWELDGRFVVGYSGNIGRAHEIQTIIDAAEQLADDDRIRFVIIGGGAQLERLRDAIMSKGLKNMILKEYQPVDMLKYSLSLPDLHLVSLKPELEGLIVPSKFYGIAAAGRPVLFIGSPEGEISNILRQFACGYTVEPGNAAQASLLIRRLCNDPDEIEEMGRAARFVYDNKYRKSFSYDAWQKVIDSV